jgi:hypothetical protein
VDFGALKFKLGTEHRWTRPRDTPGPVVGGGADLTNWKNLLKNDLVSTAIGAVQYLVHKQL